MSEAYSQSPLNSVRHVSSPLYNANVKNFNLTSPSSQLINTKPPPEHRRSIDMQQQQQHQQQHISVSGGGVHSSNNNELTSGSHLNAKLKVAPTETAAAPSSVDAGFEYLDLNELDAIISKLKSDITVKKPSHAAASAATHATSATANSGSNNQASRAAKAAARLSLIELLDQQTDLKASNTCDSPISLHSSHHHNSSHVHHHHQQQQQQQQHNAHHHHHHRKHQSGQAAHHHQRRYETVLFKELMQFGIKKEKIEKALSATGYQASLDAINWLIRHSRDPWLNNESIISTRDFLLVMCPVGTLATQIATFLQQSKLKCGANEAHYNNMMPFMKLSPFFKDSVFYFVFILIFKKYISLLKKQINIFVDHLASRQWSEQPAQSLRLSIQVDFGVDNNRFNKRHYDRHRHGSWARRSRTSNASTTTTTTTTTTSKQSAVTTHAQRD